MIFNSNTIKCLQINNMRKTYAMKKPKMLPALTHRLLRAGECTLPTVVFPQTAWSCVHIVYYLHIFFKNFKICDTVYIFNKIYF